MAATTIVFAIGSVSCASTGAVPKPFPTPGSPASPRPPTPPAPRPPGSPDRPAAGKTPPTSGSFDGYALAGTALAFRGAPYRNGGDDPTGFDCSGFTQYVYAQYGMALPREVRQQYRLGHPVKPEELAPGDLIFFTTVAPGASHVAIAIGGDEFVHAPSASGVVRVERLGSRYWSPRFVGVRRLQN
jgi:cell wall-associated NlpC family hydrolase